MCYDTDVVCSEGRQRDGIGEGSDEGAAAQSE